MNTALSRLAISAAVILQAACVTGHRTLELPSTSAAQVPTSVLGHVYIASVTDDRKFENKPSDPSIPSIAGDVTTMTAADKDQMIGRQRNTWGHAMGDIKLPGGETVTQRVRVIAVEALARDGYQVTDNPNAPTKVAISINEFWAWMNPGFWTLTFQAKIMCTVGVNNGDGRTHSVVARGYGTNPGQFAKDVNWQDAYAPALEDFRTNLASALQQTGLRADGKDASPAPSREKYDQIAKLKQLLDSGALTQTEFDREKAKVLGQP
ncbi:MAG: SHOCT domain-containing protein [Steroidobacteraceae bacterium]